jgi:phosphate transport system substrate-binding protein
MVSNSLKKIAAGLAVVMMIGSFAGCSKGGNDQSGTGTGNKSETSGSITAAGSTALLPLVEKAAAAFKEKNPNTIVNVQGGGSGTGLTQVAQGAIEIGNSDKFANEQNGLDANALVDHKVCVAGFAMVANAGIKIDSLTKEQIIGIFTGKIKNWKDVGGDDKNIVVINRPKSSGTRFTFKKYILSGQDEVEGVALTEDSSGAVKNALKTTDGAVGYLALSYITEDVKKEIKTLKIDGIEANKENITSGKYPFWAYEHMYTKGEAAGLTKTFLEYMTSDEVKPLIDKLGYVPVNDMKVQR